MRNGSSRGNMSNRPENDFAELCQKNKEIRSRDLGIYSNPEHRATQDESSRLK